MLTDNELNHLLKQPFDKLNAKYSRAMSKYISDGYFYILRGDGKIEKIVGDEAIKLLNEVVCVLYTKSKLSEICKKR